MDICPLRMRSVACTTAFESGQTIVGLSASMIQCAHWSMAVAAATASISHGFHNAMYVLSLALAYWTGRGVSFPLIFLRTKRHHPMHGGDCAPSGWRMSCSFGFGRVRVEACLRWSWAWLKEAKSAGVHWNSLIPFVCSCAVALSNGSMTAARFGRAGRRVL